VWTPNYSKTKGIENSEVDMNVAVGRTKCQFSVQKGKDEA